KEVIRETPDASTIVFEIPEHLKETFHYQPGQYITVSVQLNGKEERRAYSFSSSPYTNAFPAITVKKVTDGRVSPYMNDVLKAGDNILLMPPLGKFTTPISAQNRKHYILFGGGSGITPVMSILKSVLTQEPQSLVSLVYANRDEQSIIFREELIQLSQSYSDRLNVFHCLENPPAGFNGFSGRPGISDYQSIVNQLTKSGYPTEYFICGPGGMMDTVKSALTGMQIPENTIHTEYFNAPITPKESSPVATEEEAFDGTAQATILFNGNEFEIEIQDGTTILEAAKDQDVDPPYACQMGVCTTCRAKLLEGTARMDEREGLSDAEINEGYILTCQAHPTSAKIKLIYE
ncbi:MAG: ferredoxin--NADP reductase, partial [Bacteroidota bacterium]|nr:ferredoxin--NADP reductase [Bacteroidota bacterium]MDX5430121.1 ferredoxin--NADP reductase [Bacteroidota bacterium]MDX5468882.1 ferredoxin--NADP reductase [Bacteroidota bacterium]